MPSVRHRLDSPPKERLRRAAQSRLAPAHGLSLESPPGSGERHVWWGTLPLLTPGAARTERRRRTLQRLRRTLHAIQARDFFPPPEREQARRAVEGLAELVEVAE